MNWDLGGAPSAWAFGGQGLYVSPGRDLVVAFAGTPAEDGSVNLLRWFSRSLALSLGA